MKLFMTISILFIMLGATAYIAPDHFSERKLNLYDENWNRSGYIVRDRFQPDRYCIYDEDWHVQGHIEKENRFYERREYRSLP